MITKDHLVVWYLLLLFLHIDRQKFQQRIRDAVFICYPMGMKAYKLLDLESKHIFISIDVFHEDIYLFQHSLTESTTNPFIIQTLPHHIDPMVDHLVCPSNDLANIESDDNTLLDNPVSNAPFQRPSRNRKPPSYLHEFHCHLLQSTSQPSTVNYPVSDVISYEKLSPSYQKYIYALST